MEIPNNHLTPNSPFLQKLPVAATSSNESPTTVTEVGKIELEGSFQGGNPSSPAIAIKNVPTSQTAKSILKNRSSYNTRGKIPTESSDLQTRSIRFADTTKSHDGGERPKKITSPIKAAFTTLRSQPTHASITPPRYTPRQAAQHYLPEEYSKNDDIERMAKKASTIVVEQVKKAATAVTNFVKAPEDFFIPEQPVRKTQIPKPPTTSK